jgi:hypothetical protein
MPGGEYSASSVSVEVYRIAPEHLADVFRPFTAQLRNWYHVVV